MKKRGRRIALAATVLGLATIVVAAVLLRERIVEEWYLRLLGSGSPQMRAAAIQKLGEIGSEKALLRLHEEYDLKCPPGQMQAQRMRNGVGMGIAINLTNVDLSPDETMNSFAQGGELRRAIGRIEERIGPERAIARYMAIIESTSVKPRTRVYLSANVIFGTAGLLAGNYVHDWIMLEGKDQSFEDQNLDWRKFSSERVRAIRAMIPFLTDEEDLCRAISIHVMGLCGPEAAVAIPELEKCAQDPQPEIRQAATEALKRIRGE
jgi:HEAT repeat protein